MSPSTQQRAKAGWTMTPIAEIEVKPDENPTISLGIYTEHNPPKGFSVEIAPDPSPIDSIISTISSVGTPRQYELILSIINNSGKTISAEVRKL